MTPEMYVAPGKPKAEKPVEKPVVEKKPLLKRKKKSKVEDA